MIIDAKCINCKHYDSLSFLGSAYCTKHKHNVYFVNKICRYWQPPLKTMDVWMERNNEEPPTAHNSDYAKCDQCDFWRGSAYRQCQDCGRHFA